MDIDLSPLQIGFKYDRPYLANLWGYNGYQAISRGVVTPSGTSYILLFVTKEKQDCLTQYKDYLDGNILHWEGEEKHGSDQRIIHTLENNNKDKIYLFYRDIHHTPFIYYGRIYLQSYTRLTEEPSQFIFLVGNQRQSFNLLEDISLHKSEYENLKETEQESLIKSRIGQGIFREKLIELWGGCSVTGLSNVRLLKASHIKPWRKSSNQERLDPYNGLLLIPSLDHLFDTGYISFNDQGEIIISAVLTDSDIEILNINRGMVLRKLVDNTRKYLCFHRDNIFIR